MVMGHLPIVNQETLRGVLATGHISTRGDLKEQVVKTIADLFSDVLATREGDLVFPWIVRGDGGDNIGFKYVFKVAAAPIYVKHDPYPVKIPLGTEGLEFQNPLPEAEAVDLWGRKLLWNAIGKKSLRRGRSLTHQTPMENERMLELLRGRNSRPPRKVRLGKTSFRGEAITIDPRQDAWDSGLEAKLGSLPVAQRISSLTLRGIPWRSGENFINEKALEAWLVQNIDKPAAGGLRDKILVSKEPIECFGNYLPFGVSGSNIDVVIVQDNSQGKAVTVIELKVKSLSQGNFDQAAKQVVDYSLFIARAFNSFGIKVKLNPIVLSGLPTRSFFSSFTKEGLTPRWLGYSIDASGVVSFKKVL